MLKKSKLVFNLFLFFIFLFLVYSCKHSSNLQDPSQPESNSSEPEILWTKTFGSGAAEQAVSVQQTNDGGYIILGNTESYGNGHSDAWLIKTDANGNETWSKTFGGPENDGPSSIQQTNDNGYIFTGLTCSFGNGGEDFWIVKTDENGNELWTKTFGGPANDRGQSILQTSDRGYIITGGTYSFGDGSGDIWLIKTDENGEEIWNRSYGGAGDQKAYTVQQTSDGGYILAGFTDPSSNLIYDILLIKVDGNGNQSWSQIFGGQDTENAYSCQITNDGGCILAGYTRSFGNGLQDIWLIKTDTNGNEVWNKTFGGTGTDVTYSAQQTRDGGYIIGGFTDSKGNGESDFWLIKTNQNGDLVWDRTCGGSLNEYAFSVRETSEGRYIIVGDTNSSGNGETDFYVVLLNSD